jgi:hypothetical protein
MNSSKADGYNPRDHCIPHIDVVIATTSAFVIATMITWVRIVNKYCMSESPCFCFNKLFAISIRFWCQLSDTSTF